VPLVSKAAEKNTIFDLLYFWESLKRHIEMFNRHSTMYCSAFS